MVSYTACKSACQTAPTWFINFLLRAFFTSGLLNANTAMPGSQKSWTVSERHIQQPSQLEWPLP